MLLAGLSDFLKDVKNINLKIKIMKKFFSLLLLFFATTFLVNAQIPTNGLVAWYPFIGNAHDSSGNGYNGTIMNGAYLTTDRFGNANNAYSFDGMNDYINIITTNGFSQFNNPQTQYTFIAWIKTSTPTNSVKPTIFQIVQKMVGWG